MIKVNHLTKLFSNGKGVNCLDFEVGEGTIFGYLGPNGAGKTTTIRNLLGFLRPTEGNCSIKGLDCWKNASEIQRFLGYIPGEIAFINGFTGISFLRLLADMRGERNARRMRDLIDRFELDASGKIKRMSKGMKQKLGIIAACFHDPEIMIFDEPTAGLDPLMRNTFIDFIHEEKKRGKTVLMSSHSFEEIDRSCDSAGIIKDGHLVDVQDISELKSRQRKMYRVTLVDEAEALKLVGDENVGVSVQKNQVTLSIEGSADALLKRLAAYNVTNLENQELTLEQVFMRYYGREGNK